jgi:hypothetical protein
VLQDWVIDLPLREQGTLLTAVRGCDLTPKYPLDSIERRLVGAIRWAFMNPADPREVGLEPGCFFIPHVPLDWRASELGHYPLHWLSHIMHACEVIGYRHPDPQIRADFHAIYRMMVHSLHLNLETRDQMIVRLSEDRIATGTVVS